MFILSYEIENETEMKRTALQEAIDLLEEMQEENARLIEKLEFLQAQKLEVEEIYITMVQEKHEETSRLKFAITAHEQEIDRLRAEVERLKKQSGIMTDDMLDQFDKP